MPAIMKRPWRALAAAASASRVMRVVYDHLPSFTSYLSTIHEPPIAATI